MPIGWDDIVWVAATAGLYDPDAGGAARAVASLIANRARAGALHVAARDRPHPLFGDGSLKSACRSLIATNPLPADGGSAVDTPSIARTKAFAWASLVVLGEVDDVTCGAKYFHHHLEDPAWASRSTPRALIGGYFFYESMDSIADAPGEAKF